MGIIDLRIPGTYIVTFVIFIGIFGHFKNPAVGFLMHSILQHLCGGGLMLGAWFMATDYVTCRSPQGRQYVYGILLGILTGLFRLFGGQQRSFPMRSLSVNNCTLIGEVTLPKTIFGKGGEK